MKAIVITEPGTPAVLKVMERPVPKPSAGQVLIKVAAAGVNRPDVAQRKGSYPPPPGAPADVPGLEVAGVITECGPEVQRWKTGDKVCALIAGGGYAQYAVAYADHCLPIPANWSFAEASSLPETVFTVWHNIFQRGRLQPGENLLVHGGSSGIGITAIQLAKAFKANVFITAGTDEKCEACASLGADICINYNKDDFEQVLNTEGVDVILDMIGGDYVLKNIRLLKTEGRLVFINAMKGGEAVFNVADIMRRRLTITGSTLRNREPEFKAKLAADIEKNVWPLLANKTVKPVIYKQFPLAEAADAHSLMESSEHIGKIVLLVDE
jgi:putative PIG3 family NAD(P)H quinone oxidoreductase